MSTHSNTLWVLFLYLRNYKLKEGKNIMNKQEFLDLIAPLTQIEAERRKMAGTGFVLPSVCIGQAVLETGWGGSALMTKANAFFGIKATENWNGKVFSSSTQECYDNVNYTTITAAFRAYDTPADSVRDYYDLITNNKCYAAAVNVTDALEAITAIKNGGYATSPTYVENVMSIINSNDLTQYDNVVTENTESNLQPDIDTTKYHEGDFVTYDTIYASSTSSDGLVPSNGFTSGTITRVLPGAANPYLIDDGTGWINDGCITSEDNSNTESSDNDINVGDKVRVLVNATYDGGSFAMYYDEYDVLEVKGDRVVIGIGDVVTCAINICNIERV